MPDKNKLVDTEEIREARAVKTQFVEKRMKIKKLLAVILAFAMLLPTLPVLAQEVPEPESPVRVELVAYSNMTDRSDLFGVYFDNTLYVSAETLHEFVGAQIDYSDPDAIALRFFRGMREITFSENGTAKEHFPGGDVSFSCPFLRFRGESFISLLHVLRYLDIPITFAGNETEAVHVFITVPYTIYDAIAEFVSANGYCFRWEEAGTTQEKVEMSATALESTLCVLFHYKQSFGTVLTDKEGAEEAILEKSIRAIALEEGDGYYESLSNYLSCLNLSSDTLSAAADWLGYSTDIMDEEIRAGKIIVSSDTMQCVNEAASGLTTVVNGFVALENSISLLRTYAGMTAVQSMLLDETILSDQGRYIEDEFPTFYNAAKTVSTDIRAANDGSIRSELAGTLGDFLFDAGEGMLTGGVSTLLGALAVAQLIPGISGRLNKYDAIIDGTAGIAMEDYAVELYEGQYDWILQNNCFAEKDGWLEEYRTLQMDMILCLKSAIYARRMGAEYAGEAYEANLFDSNLAATDLLLKLEAAVITEPGKTVFYSGEDLHWIRFLQIDEFGNTCNNINAGGYAVCDSRSGTIYYMGGYACGYTTEISAEYTIDLYSYELEAVDRDGNCFTLPVEISDQPSLNCMDGWIYFRSGVPDPETGYAESTICKIRADGTGFRTVVCVSVERFYIAFGKIYYFVDTGGTEELRCCELDGTNAMTLAEYGAGDVLASWIAREDTIYMARSSMSGAVGYDSYDAEGLFEMTIHTDENGNVTVDDHLTWSGYPVSPAMQGDCIVFGSYELGGMYRYDPETESTEMLFTDIYTSLNGDLGDRLVGARSSDNEICYLDTETGMVTSAGQAGYSMNIAGNRLFYGSINGIGEDWLCWIKIDAQSKTAAPGAETPPETFISGDYEYALLDDGTAQISSYRGQEETVTIPDALDGHAVTVLGPKAFNESMNLLDVVIPSGVTTIGDEAFANCYLLSSVTIPDSVTSIGNRAFMNCIYSLTEITLPDHLTEIGDNPFVGCLKLSSITVSPDHPLLAMVDGVLVRKTDQTLITYPVSREGTQFDIFDGIEQIGGCAFAHSRLENIMIPASVTAIGERAFDACMNLTEISVPDSVTSIGSNPFCRCDSLVSITVSPDNPVLHMDDGVLFIEPDHRLVAYLSSKEDTRYVVPEGVTTIGGYAFFSAHNLEEIVIPDSVTEIEDYAFYDCSAASITLPAGVTTIGDCAFMFSDVTDFVLPDSVTYIGERAFAECLSLEVLTLPDSIKFIGEEAFIDSYCQLFVGHDSYAHQYCEENKNNYALFWALVD